MPTPRGASPRADARSSRGKPPRRGQSATARALRTPCGTSSGRAPPFEELDMCGIVGYVGPETAAPIVVDGLRRLEYRGYDSAGIAVHDGGKPQVVRAVGTLRALGEALGANPLIGTTGIGHTRWATHGRPSEAN